MFFVKNICYNDLLWWFPQLSTSETIPNGKLQYTETFRRIMKEFDAVLELKNHWEDVQVSTKGVGYLYIKKTWTPRSFPHIFISN